MVWANSLGNAYFAASVMASCIPQGGTAALINFGVYYFSINQPSRPSFDIVGNELLPLLRCYRSVHKSGLQPA